MNCYEEGHKFIVSGEECQIMFVDESDAEDSYECWPTHIIEQAQKLFDAQYIPKGFSKPYESLLEVLRGEFDDKSFWLGESELERFRVLELEEKVRKLESEPHSVIILDYSYGGEGNIEVLGVYHSFEDAKNAFYNFSQDARKVAEGRDWYIAEEFSSCFVAYKTGYYPSDHTRIFIQEVEKK